MNIPQQVKEKVKAIDSQADVILFGSRARGDAREDSDWDFLVLLKNPLSSKEEDLIRNTIYRIELEVDEIITPVIEDKPHWEMLAVTPFYKNVQRDGIHIT